MITKIYQILLRYFLFLWLELARFMIISVWFLLLYLALQDTYWSLFDMLFLAELFKNDIFSELEGELIEGKSCALKEEEVPADLEEKSSIPSLFFKMSLDLKCLGIELTRSGDGDLDKTQEEMVFLFSEYGILNLSLT